MKQRLNPTPDRAARAAAHHAGAGGAAAPLGAPRLLAQRRAIDGSFGAAPVQRAEEEELLQGKDLLQRAQEEDEPMQGKDLLQRAQEEDEPMQGQGLLQREGDSDVDDDMLQGKDLVQRVEEEEPLQGKGLPPALQAGIAQLSGQDVSDVRVHRGSAAPAQVGAKAFAQGRDIHVAPGQEQHLPHEAWHVVQQAQGRVQPTMQAAGVAVNDNPGLEAEADAMGARAAQAGAQALAQRRKA
jgi:hypothetical protein